MVRGILRKGSCLLVILFIMISASVSEGQSFLCDLQILSATDIRQGLQSLTDLEAAEKYLRESGGKIRVLLENIRAYSPEDIQKIFPDR